MLASPSFHFHFVFSFRQRETKKVEKKDTKYSESQFLTGLVMSIQEKKKKQIVIKTELDTYTLKEFEGFRIQKCSYMVEFFKIYFLKFLDRRYIRISLFFIRNGNLLNPGISLELLIVLRF